MNKIKGHDNNKVNLIYKEGFLMLSKCKEIKKIRRDMTRIIVTAIELFLKCFSVKSIDTSPPSSFLSLL